MKWRIPVYWKGCSSDHKTQTVTGAGASTDMTSLSSNFIALYMVGRELKIICTNFLHHMLASPTLGNAMIQYENLFSMCVFYSFRRVSLDY